MGTPVGPQTKDGFGPGRAGAPVRQPGGFRAFVPRPLPPGPPLQYDDEMLFRLSLADQNLSRLDGLADVLPNPDLFVAMYVRKEAVLSSQIEGTQASLEDVVAYEAAPTGGRASADVTEVVNYVSAMNYGLQRLSEFPLSLRLIREIHERLLTGTRGSEKSPGEFRRSQNWIGPPGCLLSGASFVPPPVHEMNEALGELERFIRSDAYVPTLIRCGLIHCQFETIHPFLDGNGRIGRLLITFLLCHARVLSRPLLYLSYFFKRHRGEYYERLQLVREHGDWEGWLKFFLSGVAEVSEQASATAKRIVAMQAEHRTLLQARTRHLTPMRLLDRLYERPMISVREAAKLLGTEHYNIANRAVRALEEAGLLREVTSKERGRLFAYHPYLDLLKEGTEPETIAR